MPESAAEASGHFLAFMLGEDSFAIDVSRVEVVLETQPITRVPRAQPFLRGVTNHRGSVVPIVDLRMRFGLGPSEIRSSTRIVVMRIQYGEDQVTVGMLADSVREVVSLKMAGVEKPPRIGARIKDSVIAGIAKDDSGFIVIINIDEVFKDADAQGIRAMQVSSTPSQTPLKALSKTEG